MVHVAPDRLDESLFGRAQKPDSPDGVATQSPGRLDAMAAVEDDGMFPPYDDRRPRAHGLHQKFDVLLIQAAAAYALAHTQFRDG
jgi:hypothetical protein